GLAYSDRSGARGGPREPLRGLGRARGDHGRRRGLAASRSRAPGVDRSPRYREPHVQGGRFNVARDEHTVPWAHLVKPSQGSREVDDPRQAAYDAAMGWLAGSNYGGDEPELDASDATRREGTPEGESHACHRIRPYDGEHARPRASAPLLPRCARPGAVAAGRIPGRESRFRVRPGFPRDHYRYPAHPCGRARHAQYGSLLPGAASDGHAPTPCGAAGARHQGGGDRPSSVGSAGVWSAVQTLGPRWE